MTRVPGAARCPNPLSPGNSNGAAATLRRGELGDHLAERAVTALYRCVSPAGDPVAVVNRHLFPPIQGSVGAHGAPRLQFRPVPVASP